MAEKAKTTETEAESLFNTLCSVDVSKHVEEKDTGKIKLKYLSWAWAWAEVKSRCPNASYEIIKFDGLPYVYDDKTGFMVYTTVTIDGITHEMWLPVMDSNNRAMKAHAYEVKTKYNTFTVNPASMMDINKTIMRCLTKNLAMFGLGLSLYAGCDLIDFDDYEPAEAKAPAETPAPAPAPVKETKTTSSKGKTKTQAKEDAKKAYADLIDYCKAHQHDVRDVAKQFSLNATSSAEEFNEALNRLRYTDAKNGKQMEMPMEV